MQLTYRRCSNCCFWGREEGFAVWERDDVLITYCEKVEVPDDRLGMTNRITKGSDSCGQWKRV